jgi:hypothetical protein
VTTAKTLALTAGVAGAIALGVYAVPRIDMDRHNDSAPVVTESRPAETAPAVKREAPRAARRAPAAPAVAVDAPELHARLKPVLNRGTKMTVAADGFSNAEQFATIAHAAKNTGVPFVVLKHRVLEEGKSLTAAIRESKPDLNAAAEVRKARAAAREDLSSIAG